MRLSDLIPETAGPEAEKMLVHLRDCLFMGPSIYGARTATEQNALKQNLQLLHSTPRSTLSGRSGMLITATGSAPLGQLEVCLFL